MISSLSLLNTSKYKNDTYLLLIGDNVTEVNHQTKTFPGTSIDIIHMYLTLLYRALISSITQLSHSN